MVFGASICFVYTFYLLRCTVTVHEGQNGYSVKGRAYTLFFIWAPIYHSIPRSKTMYKERRSNRIYNQTIPECITCYKRFGGNCPCGVNIGVACHCGGGGGGGCDLHPLRYMVT